MKTATFCDRAMILARGLGTRMQKEVEGLKLDAQTAKLASQGAKGLISVGRPFLDHTLQALLEAGVKDFCLVAPPGASAIRRYYEAVAASLPADCRIDFAAQEQPLGTANAVLAGEDWGKRGNFMVFNSDNFYPPRAVRELACTSAPATTAFEREALIARSNIPADRIRRFAVMDIDQEGFLRRILEKPENPQQYARDGKLYVSMNCFLFTPDILRACREIPVNPIRKEYELPTAVQLTIDTYGLKYAAVSSAEGVLDLTGRDDIEPVRKMLAGHKVSFPEPKVKLD
jgi:glucose-1-phosphate thymidylyltransferase